MQYTFETKSQVTEVLMLSVQVLRGAAAYSVSRNGRSSSFIYYSHYLKNHHIYYGAWLKSLNLLLC